MAPEQGLGPAHLPSSVRGLFFYSAGDQLGSILYWIGNLAKQRLPADLNYPPKNRTDVSRPTLLIAQFLLLACMLMPEIKAQPLKGMLWNPPDQTDRAIDQALQMHGAGVEAVRTDFFVDEQLFVVLDTLGMQVYMDLPLRFVTASMLGDTLDWAKAQLSSAFALARRHSSLRNFGLLKEGHTQNEAACSALAELNAFSKSRAPAGSRTYYSTRFIGSDSCIEEVDQVLFIGAGEHPDYFQEITGPAKGIASAGILVDDSKIGLSNENSPEAQARFFEGLLTDVRESSARDLGVFFISCWMDEIRSYPNFSGTAANPFLRTCGLIDATGAPRPAKEVVSGFFTGGREIFAFDQGKNERSSHHWYVIAGWLVIGLIVYAHSRFPTFQSMLWRYFTAHGFYREAIQGGRERLFVPNSLIMGAFMLASGLTGGVLLGTLKLHIVSDVLVRWLPGNIAYTFYSVVSNPVTLVVLIAFIFVFNMVIWTTILTLFSARSDRSLIPGQGLVLVMWPHWPILAIMAFALVVPTLGRDESMLLASILIVVWMIVALFSTIRTLRDYFAIARPPFWVRLLTMVLNPYVLSLVFLLYMMFQNFERVRYLWHLIIYT